MSEHKPKKIASQERISNLIFVSLVFLFVWIWLKPNLIFRAQEPVFFTGNSFFQEFLKYPGGVVDYLSAFLSQFYIYQIVGALLLTFVIVAVSLITNQIIKRFNNGRRIFLLNLIPAILLFGMILNYNLPLSYTLAMLFALVFFLIYHAGTKWPALLRIAWFLILFAVLYFFAASGFGIFALLCLLNELFNTSDSWFRRAAVILSFILIGFFVPYLSVEYLFLIFSKTTYTYLLPFSLEFKIALLPYLLYLFFPVTALILNLFVRRQKKTRLEKESIQVIFGPKKFNLILQPVLILILAVLVVLFSFEKEKKFVLNLNEAAQFSGWNEILEQVKDQKIISQRIVAFQMNRALFESGRLSDEMFGFPQNPGVDGLINTSSKVLPYLMENSDLMFAMGHINSSQYWAYEALSIQGETPRILKRMAQIHLLKNEFAMATKCLEKLKFTLFNRQWAEHFMEIISKPELLQGERNLLQIQALMPKTDFLIRGGFPKVELVDLLKCNPQNRMAFEYLMAYDLLNCRLDHFMKNFDQIKERAFQKIAKHYEEAVVLYFASRGEENPKLPGAFDLGTFQRFAEFMQVLSRYENNKILARAELLKKFGNTYWFYYLYMEQVEIKR